MPGGDADRWNSRYQSDSATASDLTSSLLVNHANLLPSSGLALDIATGLGRNARYLVQRGLRVVGVDISHVALIRAKKDIPSLMAAVLDLERFVIPPNKFDVILNILYLQRNLWMQITQGLKLGGLLYMECLTEDMLSIHPEINPSYLLKPAELQHAFYDGDFGRNLEILYYYEGWSPSTSSHRRAVASLIARRNA